MSLRHSNSIGSVGMATEERGIASWVEMAVGERDELTFPPDLLFCLNLFFLFLLLPFRQKLLRLFLPLPFLLNLFDPDICRPEKIEIGMQVATTTDSVEIAAGGR